MNQFLNEKTGFREFLLSSHVPYVVTSPQGKFLMANAAFASTLGYTPRDLEMVDLYSLTHPEDRETSREMIEAMLRGDRIGDRLIKRYLHRQGQVVWVDLNATLLRTEEGSPRFFITSIIDITEQRQAMAHLETSERETRLLFESMREAFTVNRVVTDALGDPIDFEILNVNEPYLAMVGRRRDEVLGQSFLKLFPNADRAMVRNFCQVGLTGKPFNVEYFSQALSRHLSTRVYSPRPGVFATIVEDITARKQMDDLMQRTDKLEALGLLAGGIAHDFNNFLAGLSQWLEVARTAADPQSKVAVTLEKALKMFDRARGLTQQLLTFSKGGTPILSTAVLRPVIEDSVRFALSGSTTTATFDFPDDLWPCDFDQNQLGQVVDNLVINAVQAMGAGGRITVSARNLPAEHQVLMEFRDTGPGIPPEVLSHVFDPFFTTKAGGNGLGLATCHSIVTKHGGTITVSSVVGQGTTFAIRLPASAETAAVSPPSPTELKHGQGRVLVLDDELEIREALAEMLSLLGYEAVTAAHGAEALDVAARALRQGRGFHVALLDLTIPGGEGGREIAGPLKALDPHVKLYVTSGYSDGAVMANPTAFGFEGGLVKPFSMAELAEMVSRGLSGR